MIPGKYFQNMLLFTVRWCWEGSGRKRDRGRKRGKAQEAGRAGGQNSSSSGRAVQDWLCCRT